MADEQPCVGVALHDEIEAPHAGILRLRIRRGRLGVHREVGRTLEISCEAPKLAGFVSS
jgi:hypothetical protein